MHKSIVDFLNDFNIIEITIASSIGSALYNIVLEITKFLGSPLTGQIKGYGVVRLGIFELNLGSLLVNLVNMVVIFALSYLLYIYLSHSNKTSNQSVDITNDGENMNDLIAESYVVNKL